MAENNLGRNITFPIYYDTVDNGTATQQETGLVIHKATVETSVMSLGDKITGDVYYANNSLQVTMQEYIVYNDVRYILVSPPTIIREGMVSENGELKGMTKYSFVFYHPMYVLSNFPFSDVAVTNDEKRYLSENKVFSWIGKPQDFIDKLNKNLEGTEWIVVKSSNFPQDTEDELSDVLKFDNNTIADALKTGYETWGLPYVIDQIHQGEQYYSSGKRFKVIFGLPSNAIMDGQNEFVFRMGQGVGLKNNSRTPRNNKIVTRIAGYGSENNIPYGYPQIQWYGVSGAEFTYGDHAGVYENVTIGGRTFSKVVSYPIYKGILGGAYVELIKHPFTRNHLMPSKYRETLFNKVSPYLANGTANSDYDPDIELVDYYDADSDSYPNQINPSSPSYEIHAFEDIKPELGEAEIVGVQPIKNDGTDADGWDDTMDDDGNYLQSYFKITLPQLDFDMYACAAITEEMQINMRSGACIGCTFPVQVDWEDYKKNFYDDDGNFDPVIGEGHPRNASKYPDSSTGSITIIVQKEYSTFGVLMPNIYQQPASGDEFVILGISLPDTYVTSAEVRLDDEMRAYMLANNIHYYDYPLKFDEYFLATHTNILSQIRTNTQVKFQFANEKPMTLFVKQIVIKYGENVLPQYDITLTDSVEVVLNQIGKVADDVEKLSALVSVLRQSYNRNVWGEIAKKLSKTSNDTAQGEITFLQGLKIGSNGNLGIAPNGDATLADANLSGDLTITHVETPQGGEPVVKEYGITNNGDISGEGLEIGNFANSGLLGTGGAFKMVNGKSYLEADKLYVRMKAYFDTLEIRRYIHSGGNRVASAAGCKVSRVVGSSGGSFYRLCFKATDGDNTVTNDFTIGDFAYCHTTNLEGGELNQQNYWRLVMRYGSLNASRQIVSLNGEPVSGVEDTVVTEHFIDVANTTNLVDIGEEENYQGMMAGSTEPKAEDDVVQLGHAFDEDRQGAIIEAVTGAVQAPTYRIYQGIDSFNLENKCKVDMGYDLETHRAYLNVYGDFHFGDNNSYVKFNSGTGVLDIKAKIDATSGSPILNTINSKAQVYMNTVGTMSSVAYKAGDLWMLPAAVGTYAAGTMLVAKSDRGASFNLNDWEDVKDAEFNAYIAQIVGGGIVSSDPTDAQKAANKINAIKSALNDGTTTINGGLILTNLIALKNGIGGVTAGITGQSEGNDIALWLGGQMADVENPQTGQSNFAKSLFRFDGSGYLAGGNISWATSGNTEVKGTIRAKNLFHNVCVFQETYEHLPCHYRDGGVYQDAGSADIVFMFPNAYLWHRDATNEQDTNVAPEYYLDARTLVLPPPSEYDGKVVEVFIIAKEDRENVGSDGYGAQKNISIKTTDLAPVIGSDSLTAVDGELRTMQEGWNTVAQVSSKAGYVRLLATSCYDTNGRNHHYAWVYQIGGGSGSGITNIINPTYVTYEGASEQWVLDVLNGVRDDTGQQVEPPITNWFAQKSEVDEWIAAAIQNIDTSNFLPLSAGKGKTLTDSLFISPNKAIKINDGSTNGIDLLSFTSASGNTPAKWVLGTGDNGIIRSGGELYRWVDNNTQYKIWDASNLTPSDYATTTALATVEDNSVVDVWFNSQTGNLIVKWGTGDQAPVVLPYLSQANADERYLKLTGGMLVSSAHQTLTVSSTAEENGVANWVGIQFGHGSGDNYTRYGGIRMDELNGALKRYTSAYTAYTIWDSGNFNPSNYPTTQAVNTAISTYCNAQIANVQTWADGRFVPLVGSSTIQGTLSFSANNSTNKLTLSNNKIQLAINDVPHNVVLFEGSTQSYTSYAKFYERPMVKTGTNNGTPVYTNVALVSEIGGKQNKIHFLNTKTSGTEVEFSYMHLPLGSVSGGHASLDLSDYATKSAWKVKDVEVEETQARIFNGESVIYSAELGNDGLLTLYSTTLDIDVPTKVSDLTNDSGFITQSDGDGRYVQQSWKPAILSPYTAGGAVGISSGVDLNDFETSGTYYCQSAVVAGTLSNCPYKDGNFRLFVLVNTGTEGRGNSWWGTQMLVTGNGLNAIYTRGHSDRTWTTWRRANPIIRNTLNNSAEVPLVENLCLPLSIGTGTGTGYATLDLSAYATQAWANGRFVTALGTSGNSVTYMVNGVANPITVPYATQASRLFGSYISSGKINANTMTVDDTKYSVLANYYSTQNVWENAPNGMGYGAITELNAGSGVGVLSGQLAWDVNHDSNTPTNRIWWRARNSTGWGDDWQQFVMYRYVGTGAVDTYAGTFAFGGSNAIQAGYDYAGLQVGYESDRWQITAIGSLRWRQNDNNDLTSTWQPWRTILDTSNWSSYVTGFLPLAAGADKPVTGDLWLNGNLVAGNPNNTTNDDSAKIAFYTNKNYPNISPYIQAIYENNYGRKRLSVFQKNVADWDTPQVEVFTIKPNGNVGIGITSPSYKLDVNGVAMVRGDIHMNGDLVFEDGNFPVTLMSGASGDANYAIAQFGLRPQVLTGANTYTNVALVSDLSNFTGNVNINGDVSTAGTISSEDYIKADSDVFVGDSLYFGTDYNAPRLYIDNGHLYFNGTRIA